tara:strand:- start:71 stop:631 length:561 start_codon:yes stop_codon:yes gene_type:complete
MNIFSNKLKLMDLQHRTITRFPYAIRGAKVFGRLKIGQRHLVRERDINPVSDYLYESSTDSLIRISVQNLKKYLPILNDKKPGRKSTNGKCFGFDLFCDSDFQVLVRPTKKEKYSRYKMKLWVDTITRYFDKLPTQFIVENTQIKLLEKINTDAKENTFEKMSTTVQQDDKELDEFGVSESKIYGS